MFLYLNYVQFTFTFPYISSPPINQQNLFGGTYQLDEFVFLLIVIWVYFALLCNSYLKFIWLYQCFVLAKSRSFFVLNSRNIIVKVFINKCTGFPPRHTRGPMCYDCDDMATKDGCRSVTACSQNEVRKICNCE